MKVELIDHMGDDLRVVNAARVSFDKESELVGDKDARLIEYLAKHNHFTPFTHCTVTLRETVPIFVARQRFKHTVGFSYNEVSRRYVSDDPEFYHPDEWRLAAEDKKQGSADETIEVLNLTRAQRGKVRVTYNINDYKKNVEGYCLELYRNMVDNGVCPEQARMVLPQSMYTSYYVTGSLSAWARAYSLRSKPDAQKEIQELASQWDTVIAPLFPVSWKALTT